MKVRQAMLTHWEVLKLIVLVEQDMRDSRDNNLLLKLTNLRDRFVGRETTR